MTVLNTARLTLRPARPDDLAAMHGIFADPRAMRYWSHPEHETLAQSETALAHLIATPTEFILERQGVVIGKAGAWREWELGYILQPDHWGQGLMTEALHAVIDHLFSQPQVSALTAELDPRNVASLGVLTKLGFVETGRAERTLQWRDEWCDSLYLALPRPTDPEPKTLV